MQKPKKDGSVEGWLKWKKTKSIATFLFETSLIDKVHSFSYIYLVISFSTCSLSSSWNYSPIIAKSKTQLSLHMKTNGALCSVQRWKWVHILDTLLIEEENLLCNLMINKIYCVSNIWYPRSKATTLSNFFFIIFSYIL